MNFGFDEYDKSIYDSRQLPSTSNGNRSAGGGMVSAGDFGAVRPHEETPVMRYINRINPNVPIAGIFAAAMLWMMSGLIGSLGKANPNNQMMQLSQSRAEADKETAKTNAEAIKALANQKSGCVSFICVTLGGSNQPTQAQPVTSPGTQQQPSYPPYYQGGQFVGAASQPAASAPVVPAIPTDAKTIGYWQYYKSDAAYIGRWQQYCSTYGWNVQPECSALYQSLNQ